MRGAIYLRFQTKQDDIIASRNLYLFMLTPGNNTMAKAYKTKIGHAHLKVRDLQRSIDFYIRFLGLDVTEVVGNHYAFLTAGTYHHEIALQNVGSDAPHPPARGTGLYHVAFEVPDKRSFALAYRALQEAGISVHSCGSLTSVGQCILTTPMAMDSKSTVILAHNLGDANLVWR